jgi:hypothetical protein
MAQREFDEPSTSIGHDDLEDLDRRPDLSELHEGEVMSAGRHVIEEGRVRERLNGVGSRGVDSRGAVVEQPDTG